MNKRLIKAVMMGFCFFALLLFNGPVYADAVLYTPVIHEAGDNVRCSILNISDKTREVTIEVRDGAPAGGAIHGSTTLDLFPGSAYSLDPTATCTNGCEIYCKFIVQGNKHEYLVSICDPVKGCLPGE